MDDFKQTPDESDALEMLARASQEDAKFTPELISPSANVVIDDVNYCFADQTRVSVRFAYILAKEEECELRQETTPWKERYRCCWA